MFMHDIVQFGPGELELQPLAGLPQFLCLVFLFSPSSLENVCPSDQDWQFPHASNSYKLKEIALYNVPVGRR